MASKVESRKSKMKERSRPYPEGSDAANIEGKVPLVPGYVCGSLLQRDERDERDVRDVRDVLYDLRTPVHWRQEMRNQH